MRLFLMHGYFLLQLRERNANATFISQQPDTMLQEIGQADHFTEDHQKIMPVHDEKGWGVPPRDRVSGWRTDVIQGNEDAAREGRLALDLSFEDEQVGFR